MPDIQNVTTDVTVFAADGGNSMDVNSDNEGLVHDQHAIDILQEIADSTGTVELKTATSWQYYASINKAFVATRYATLGGSGESNFILLKNPLDSGYNILIKRITFGVATPSTAGTFRLYKHPTVTADGSSLQIENFKGIDIAGIATTWYNPTITDRSHIFKQFELNSSGTGLLDDDEDLAIIIEPGRYFLVTIETSAANKSFAVNLSWAEELIET